ncbi:MAG: hypothetical protein WD851_04405 [Pirellulales bacterium]
MARRSQRTEAQPPQPQLASAPQPQPASQPQLASQQRLRWNKPRNRLNSRGRQHGSQHESQQESQPQSASQPQLGSHGAAQLGSQGAAQQGSQQAGSQQRLRWHMPFNRLNRPGRPQGSQQESQQVGSQQQLGSQPQPPPHPNKPALALSALPSTSATPRHSIDSTDERVISNAPQKLGGGKHVFAPALRVAWDSPSITGSRRTSYHASASGSDAWELFKPYRLTNRPMFTNRLIFCVFPETPGRFVPTVWNRIGVPRRGQIPHCGRPR